MRRRHGISSFLLHRGDRDLASVRRDLRSVIGCFASDVHSVLLDVGLKASYRESWDEETHQARQRLEDLGVAGDPVWLIATVSPPLLFEELDSVLAMMAVGMSSEIAVGRRGSCLLNCKPDHMSLNLSDEQTLVMRTFAADVARRLEPV